MEAIQVVTLSLVQGLTEFLPVSSSGHLALLPSLANWDDQGLAFDVAVHVGTLVAVLAYFRTDLRIIIRDWRSSLAARRPVGESNLGWAVLIGTIPGGACGFALNWYGAEIFRSPLVIGLATIGFGLLLWWADWRGKQSRDEHQLEWADVVVIGCAQVLALVPGASRSGVTITAGMAMGLTRAAAARFSFLLSIPIIAAAGLVTGIDASASPETVNWGELVVGALIAGVSAYLCIHYFLKLLARIGFLPFVIYRVLLGVAILLVV